MMEFFQNYYETGARIRSKAAQDEYFGAIVRYLFTGETQKFKYEASEVGFKGIFPSLERQRAKSIAGKLSATKRATERATETPTEAQQKGEQTDQQNANEAGNKLSSYQAIKLSSIDTPYSPPAFAWRCVDAFNRVFGTTYSTLPEKCEHILERFADTYSVADVEAMIRYKRDEWQGTRFAKALTPNTLFSPEHFEQYMHQSKDATRERDEYAAYN